MAARSADRPRIFVIAGVNGAGKSSVVGARIRYSGAEYFNPDEVASDLRRLDHQQSRARANGLAWTRGKELLERAIASRVDHAFETTLGGRTITSLLEDAIRQEIEVLMWYVGLATPELHIERVEARVRRGGHPIPESDIRSRWDQSRRNVIRLLPGLAELRVFDNSDYADPRSNQVPEPKLLLYLREQRIIGDLGPVPTWAKPIVAAALRLRLQL